jgi:hypothetical protein
LIPQRHARRGDIVDVAAIRQHPSGGMYGMCSGGQVGSVLRRFSPTTRKSSSEAGNAAASVA